MTRFFLFVALLICASLAGAVASSGAKTLAREVQISDLAACDGKRVALSGVWPRDIQVRRGRLGSRYMHMTVWDGDYSVNVIISSRVFVRDHPVIVTGVYHKVARFAGIDKFNVIIADVVMVDF